MFRLVKGGIVAACWQCWLVVFATLLVLVFGRTFADAAFDDADRVFADEVILTRWQLFLKLAYCVSAVGLSITRTWFVDFSALQIETASKALYPSQPRRAAEILAASLIACTIGSLIFALRPPERFLVDLTEDAFGVASLTWSAGFSVLAAGFGASACASVLATRR